MLIVGKNEDPGDASHRTCMSMLGDLWTKGTSDIPTSVFDLLECPEKPHHYVRHNSPGWWSDCDRFSRDQATPLLIAMGETNQRHRVIGFLWAHIKRLGFFTNTRRNGATAENHGNPVYESDPDYKRYNYNWKLPDICTLEFIGLYIRTLNLWFLYPLLLLIDLETFISSVHWLFRKENDNLNHLIITRYINRKYPTPLGYLSIAIEDHKQMYLKLEAYSKRIGLDLHTQWKQLIYEPS